MDAGTRSEDYICDECGMVYEAHGPDELVDGARAIAPRWRDLVTGVDVHVLRTRPDPETWSASEYGWHIGTGLDWMAQTLDTMVQEDLPTIDWFGHERDVAESDPNQRDLDEITTRIDRGSSRLATVLASIDRDEWDREAEFVWGRRDALDMARNAVHEGEHHLRDVASVIDAVRG